MLIPKRRCTTYIGAEGQHYIMFTHKSDKYMPEQVYAIYIFRNDTLTEYQHFNTLEEAEDYARGMTKPFDLKEFDYLYERLNWYLSRKTCRMYIADNTKSQCIAYISLAMTIDATGVYQEPTIYVWNGKHLRKYVKCDTVEYAQEFLTCMCKGHSYDTIDYDRLLASLDDKHLRHWRNKYGRKMVDN